MKKKKKLIMLNSILYLIMSFMSDYISCDEFVNRLLLILKRQYFDKK